MVLGDRFVSFKACGDRRDDSFFFYRAGYYMAERGERPKKKSHQKIVLLLVFLVEGDGGRPLNAVVASLVCPA